MSALHDLVQQHLERLYRHRELVSAAYRHGVVSSGHDKAAGRGIAELTASRVLVPITHDTFRLSSSIVRHLDEVLQKQRLFASIGADVAELADAIPRISYEIEMAAREGRIEDVDAHVDQFDRAVFDLSDSIRTALQHLRALVDSRFANVSTLKEKLRQNEFYVDRAQRISTALMAIDTNGMIASLGSHPEGERLGRVYAREIVSNLGVWRAQLLDITAVLREYLYRTRRIESTARTMRAFYHHLRRVPDYAPPDLDALPEWPAWVNRAAGIRVGGHARVVDSNYPDELAAIARNLPTERPFAPPAPVVGTLLPQSEPAPEDAARRQQTAWRRSLRRLLAAARNSPVSAMGWKRSDRELDEVADDIWLLCLLHESALQRSRSRTIRFEVITDKEPPLSGRVSVKDVVLLEVSVAPAGG